MKKTFLTLAVTGVLVAGSLTASAQEDKKAAAARKDIAEGKEDLRMAKMDSSLDYQNFKKQAEMEISNNQKKIAALKSKKSQDSKEIKEKYDKKVLALDKENNELKKRIKESGGTKTTKWASFKREFTHDMGELGHAIKGMGVDNAR